MNRNLEREIRWLIDEKYGDIRTPDAEKDIERLEAGEHIAYVIGFVEFLGSKIDLSSRPMIPRPETEFWVLKAIDELKSKKGDLRIMDAFSGSGCIGVSLLRHIPNAKVEFLENNPAFLSQIQMNIEKNGVDDHRTKILSSDVFSVARGAYDAIFANPPYVDEESLTPEEREELSIELREAMYAPDKGFYFVEKVLREAPVFLKPGGLLYCEIEEDQGERALRFKALYQEFSIERDQYGKPRYVRASC